MKKVESFRPRSIGSNWLRCFICGSIKNGHSDIKNGELIGKVEPSRVDKDGVHYSGGYNSCQPDMAARVNGLQGAKKVEKMFRAEGCRALIDYRDFEPHHVQVKIGACEEHLSNLKILERLTKEAKGISPEILRHAIKFKLAEGLN